MLPYGFPEKAQCGFLIAVDGEREVNGLALPIDSAVGIAPLPPDLDVRFVRSPARSDWAFLAFSGGSLEFRRELLNPAVNVGMINWYTPFRHHLLQVPIAQWVSQLPADAGQDDILFKSMALEVDHV